MRRSLGGPRVGLPLSAGDSVGRARELVEALEGTPVGAQRLLLRGVVLEDAGAPLGAYGFEEGDDLMLVRELQGGHCQVPCGIFDDPKLVAEIMEAVTTITKCAAQVTEIFAGTLDAKSFNQATRWTNTKEEHCGKIITLVSEYCLAQRIKPLADPKTPFKSEDEYVEALKAHHAVMQSAMKCKQTVDPALCEKLSADIDLISKMYIK